jgi:hypothetical protein
MINSKTLATSSVEDCEAYCNITPGCDGYDWCDSASGCGAYCSDHNARNPAGEQTFRTAVMPRAAVMVVQANTAQGTGRPAPWAGGAPNGAIGRAGAPGTCFELTMSSCRAEPPNLDDPTKPNPDWELPLTGLGPFGTTSK